jgi:hypothetical protein
MSTGWLVGFAVVGAAVLATGAFGAQPRAGPRIIAVELQNGDPSPGGQFVAVANRTRSTVNLGCWRLRSSSVTLTVAPPLRLRPGKVALLSPERAWLKAVDRVRLIGPKGRLRDTTPRLADRAYDDRIWFKQGTEWRFGRKVLGRGVLAGRLLATVHSCG